MALPQLRHPTIVINQPSTGKELRFRPFLVKEEKVLLMAKEEKDPRATVRAIRSMLATCLQDGTSINNMTILDLEYIFLKLRAASVSNIVKVSYRDPEDSEVYDFTVNLDKLEIEEPKERVSNRVPLADGQGIELRETPATIYEDKTLGDNSSEFMAEVISHSIAKIWDGEKVIEASTCTPAELKEFVDNLDVKSFEAASNFLGTAPRLKYVLKYKNKKGNDREIVLATLSDFFSLV